MNELKEKACTMSTLRYLNIEHCHTGVIHDVWDHNAEPLEAHMATVKARVLLQKYPLGRLHYVGKKSPKCLLCGTGEDTVEHFRLTCSTTMKKRTRFLENLYCLIIHTGVSMPVSVDIKYIPIFHKHYNIQGLTTVGY